MQGKHFLKNEDYEVLTKWNNTYKEYPFDKCLHELIEMQVQQHPDKTAVRFKDQLLSFTELNQRANQCARYLRSLGVGANSIVGVLMERSIEMVIALLGILKAGGAYLPLDPTYPEKWLMFVLEDAWVSTIFTKEKYKNTVREFEGTTYCLDSEWKYLSQESGDNLKRIITPKDAAYVIYTSGSTGKPKGCILPHRAICNRLLWMQDKYKLTGQDKILQKTPFTFDVSVWEFFWPLLSGACLIMAKPEGHKDSNYLIDIIKEEEITTCHFVPSMLRFFVGNLNVGQCDTIRQVFTSGEALSYELMLDFKKKLSEAKLHNLYGPTEAAVDVTYWECVERADKKVPIGRPISNIQIHILDSELNQVPPGQEGELHIGGIGLARGYLNRPELTAEKFINNPFSNESRTKLYKTGDRARYLPDGNIEYLGRIDFQVKLRGNRIELHEIETVLKNHEAIEEAVVMVKDEESGDSKLVGYIVAQGDLPAVRKLREFVKSKLPDYMVPNIIVALESIPVTRHGKLDRQALPWPVTDRKQKKNRINAVKKTVNVRTNVESSLLEYMGKVLDFTGVAFEDDLFDLGATSLTMVKMVEKIHEQYGITVPVEVFFNNPTIKAVVDYVCQKIAANNHSRPNGEKTTERNGDLPQNRVPLSEKPIKINIVENRKKRKTATQHDIAIIGISGRYPGARSLDEYWENLKGGKKGIRELSKRRRKLWRYDGVLGERRDISSIRGGFLDDIECFDNIFFNISHSEACIMDPQERLFLEVAWECLENAGYTPNILNHSSCKTGVFVGAMWSDYQNQSSYFSGDTPVRYASSFHSTIANRISHFFNFSGPSIALNTSSSSALTAIHFACESIKRGECKAALAGGVNLISHSYHQDFLNDFNMLSKGGECYPLGAQANGWLSGEGVGAVLLKPLEAAINYKDYIYCIIKGTAIGHSGSSSRLMIPNVTMQAESMRQAIENAGVPKASISYIELAASGASIADASEINAVKKVFQDYSDDTSPICFIGSLAANIGHLESASAISQITKVIWQMKNRALAPTINFEPVNPLIKLEGSRLEIVDRLRTWSGVNKKNGNKKSERHQPLRALINAFGATGTSAHAILEEYICRENKSIDEKKIVLIPLSAATDKQLNQQVSRLYACLNGNGFIAFDIADIGFTFQAGRIEMKERLAIIAENTECLKERLEMFLKSEGKIDGVYRGTASNQNNLNVKTNTNDLFLIAEQWVQGASVEWSTLNDGSEKRVPLPTYPFEKERHWIWEKESIKQPLP